MIKDFFTAGIVAWKEGGKVNLICVSFFQEPGTVQAGSLAQLSGTL